MDWTEEGIVLAARKHGESSAIVQLFTRGHGRHAGLVRGGAGSKARGVYQAGNLVAARWRARLAEHLGSFTCELVRAHAAAILDDPPRLAGLASACAVIEATLPERHPYPALYDATRALIEAICGEAGWLAEYVRWEVGLLGELGFGLDLERCAATGSADDLVYVSPKTGRAVSRAAGEPYREKLLALPGFLIGRGAADGEAIAAGLRLAGRFLDDHVFGPDGRAMPPARDRFVDRIARMATTSGAIVADGAS